MAKGIRSYPKSEQVKIVAKRISNNTGGLGYLAAKDAEYRIRMEAVREQVVKKEADAS